MNCIFVCVFNSEKYVELFYFLLESILLYGNLSDDTNILLYTSTKFMNMIKQNPLCNEKIIFEINDSYDNIDLACKARLDLFNLSSVSIYDKILYLDTDILVKDDIHKVFDVCRENLLYVLEQGAIDLDRDLDYWGKRLFTDNEIHNYQDKTAFTSAVLLFKNCKKIKFLFDEIKKDMLTRDHIFYDQPFIVYNAFKYNLFNNKILKSYVVNKDYNINSDKVIHHFPYAPGVGEPKIKMMHTFLTSLKDYNCNR